MEASRISPTSRADRTAFTATELATLREQFAKIETVNPDRLGEFRSIFNGCTEAAVIQLATANIKFVSKLACNEIARRAFA